MKLSHYSAIPRIIFRERRNTDVYFKPRGLWVSVDGEDDWRAWCEAETFRLQALRFKINIILEPDANILYLRSAADLFTFTEGYTATDSQVNSIMKSHSLSGTFHMDWPRVQREYDGIIIAPYQWSQRLELMWYYSWDCASGCIWNIEAIQKAEIDLMHTLKHGLRYTVKGFLESRRMSRFKLLMRKIMANR